MEGALKLVSTVGQLVGEEYRQLRGVGGQIAELRDELATMNAILQMQSEAEDGSVDHFVREWMKQVRELAYDAEDCVHLYIFRIRCRRRDRFLAWSKRLLTTVLPRRRLACEIEALHARAVAISDRHARYSVSRQALSRSPPPRPPPSLAPAPPSAASLLRLANNPGQFVGITEQATKLAEKIEATGDNNKRKVFSIFGFGGLGKTTLAIEVCRRLEPVFQRQALVSVSQAFDGSKDLQGFLQRVLQQVVKPKSSNEEGIKQEDTLGSIDKFGVDDLASKLKDLLKNTRYLIVIDDVWTTSAWSAIMSKLPENNCHSRIIVTTRMESVAKACSDASACGDYIYQMQPLKGEDAKKLFLSRAFGSTKASCPEGLKAAMGEILKKCGGLPLAIVSIAGLLANYKSSDGKDTWKRVSKSLGSHMESHPSLEGLRQIVILSYNHLPYHLKGCMMYFSIFPEDYVVEKKRLLSRWIAEGLVKEKRGLTQMEVAEACFDELVSRSMIIRSADMISYLHESREACQMHDILLEVLVSKSIEANFASLAGGLYEGMSYDRIRRLSIHGGQQGHRDSPSSKLSAGLGLRKDNEEIDVQHVRSLSMFDLGEHKLLGRLSEFTLLRVLDLEDSKGLKDKHMGDICRMYLMRFLSLKGTDITLMPPEVGNLEHLQTLDVSETQLAGLPESVTNLHQLERLLFSRKSNRDTMWEAPTGLRRMKALREASRVVIKDNIQAAEEIGDLEQLEGLLVYLDDSSRQYEEVRKKFAGSLCRTYSLRSLNVGETSNNRNTLDYLIDLSSPPPLLRFLRFAGGFSNFPEWVGSLAHLVEFTMSFGGILGDQLFNVLCKAPSLKTITLQQYFYDDDELVARTSQKFLVLKNMRVTSHTPLPKVFRFEQGSMTTLETLVVNFDDKLDKSIDGIQHLTSLKEVQLMGKKNNSALEHTLKQLKRQSDGPTKPNQFIVGVKYD